MTWDSVERDYFRIRAHGIQHSLVMCLQMIDTGNFLMAHGFLDYAIELLLNGPDPAIRIAQR